MHNSFQVIGNSIKHKQSNCAIQAIKMTNFAVLLQLIDSEKVKIYDKIIVRACKQFMFIIIFEITYSKVQGH